MGRSTKNSNRKSFLDIKTGINLYRSFVLTLLILTLACTILSLIFNRNITEIISLILLDLIFILLFIFMDKVVYILKLPTNHLIVTKDEFVFKKGRKSFVYKLNETSYKFHSFFEDFESLSQFHIFSKKREHFILITKKQHKMMVEFLGKQDN